MKSKYPIAAAAILAAGIFAFILSEPKVSPPLPPEPTEIVKPEEKAPTKNSNFEFTRSTPTSKNKKGTLTPEPSTEGFPKPSSAGPFSITVGETISADDASTNRERLDSEDLHPGLSALKELEEVAKSGNSGRISGIGSSSGTSAVDGVETPIPSPSPSPTPLPLVGGQARGYAILYLMHPHARVAVEEQIEILKRANLNEVYIGVLTDGTFHTDFDYLGTVLRSLAEGGRAVTLGVYLSNGPTMRRYKTTPIKAGFSRINPSDFRFLIRFDPSIRRSYTSMVQAVVPVLDLNRSLSPRNKNYAIVMLEDNLDADSYHTMRDLASEVIGDRATFMRNPCPGCWDGNDTYSFGDPIELHAPADPSKLHPGDGYTLDGRGFGFPWENSSDLTPDEVKRLAATSQLKGAAFFGLWRAARQGVLEGQIDPFRRNYEVPTEEQAKIEIEMLRSGLGVVN